MNTVACSCDILAPKQHSITARNRSIFRVSLIILAIIAFCGAVIFSYTYFNHDILSHPEFDENALSGIPEVGKEFGYSSLEVCQGYNIDLCGAPAFDDCRLALNLTNPAENNVWFKAEVRDKYDNLLGSTGVIKQNSYLESIELDEKLAEDLDSVIVRVIGYEPYTWQSAGTVSLKLNLVGK